ncbi:MAG: hypothetical protein V7742_12295 [Halioglobus sp.]
MGTSDPEARKPEGEAVIRQTVDVYRQRGFADVAIMNLIDSSFYALPIEQRDALALELGLAERSASDDGYVRFDSNVMENSWFEPDTGRRIQHKGILSYSKTATSCFKNGTPWKDCTLNYHPVSGCFLEGEVLKECKRISHIISTSGYDSIKGADGVKCWNYEKGPGLMLPSVSASESQIDLANAVPVTSEPGVVGRTTNVLNRHVCRAAFGDPPLDTW